MAHVLPKGFEDLERFVDRWAHQTESERNRARLTSTMKEIQEFYDATLPRLEAAVEYLNQYPLDEMPPEAQLLLNVALGFMEASVCVELFGSPDMAWAIEADRMHIDEQWKRC